MMRELSFYERQFLQKLFRQQGSIKYSFDEFVRKVGPLIAKWADHGGDSVWIGNATIEKQIERLLDDLHSQLVSNMTDTVTDVWNLGNKKADGLVSGYIKDMAISDVLKDKMFSRNADALNTLLRRKDQFGKTISSRVWDIANGAKDNLEYYLSSGLSAGRPATLISQDIRQLLNDPDRRFRRVRDANGKLVPSRPMKDYHPGQGVYRSSYKNALRLAATETNKAFRTADYERWRNMDFVKGIEVERSPSNHGPCPVCDAKAGEYPKDFKFTGWHPFCICIATPIMMDHEEFAAYLLGDEDNLDSFYDLVGKAKKIGINTRRFEDTFTKNAKYGEMAKVSLANEIKRVEENMEKERALYISVDAKEREIRLNKKYETAVSFDKDGNIILNKPGGSRHVMFTPEECKRMKNTVMTHNHPSGWDYPDNSVRRIGNSFSRDDLLLAVRYDLSEIRAVTPLYTFVMRRPEKGWGVPIDRFLEVYKEVDGLIRREGDAYVRQMGYSEESCNRASIVHFHKLNRELSKRLGWHYSKRRERY